MYNKDLYVSVLICTNLRESVQICLKLHQSVWIYKNRTNMCESVQIWTKQCESLRIYKNVCVCISMDLSESVWGCTNLCESVKSVWVCMLLYDFFYESVSLCRNLYQAVQIFKSRHDFDEFVCVSICMSWYGPVHRGNMKGKHVMESSTHGAWKCN